MSRIGFTIKLGNHAEIGKFDYLSPLTGKTSNVILPRHQQPGEIPALHMLEIVFKMLDFRTKME